VLHEPAAVFPLLRKRHAPQVEALIAACADVQLGVNPRVSLQSTNAFLRLEGELQRSKFNECMVGTSTA